MKNVISKPLASTADPVDASSVDCSRQILQSMEKEPRDRLTCVRVFDDFYRCNWWAAGALPARAEKGFQGLEVTGFCVRKSHFVKATMRDGVLVVEDAMPKKAASED